MKQIIFVFLTLFLYSSHASSKDFKSSISKWTLENGMTLIHSEDTSIPNANMYLFWKVGSRNEYPGITGLSHFFEHMMFNGAKKYGPQTFDKTMEAKGGANNAYTTEDMTVYTDWFPADAVETIFDLESDRIANLNFDDGMIESERGVVASERQTGLENSNWRTLSEEVKGVAFRAHPYSWPVIGHESDIMNWKKQDLIDFYKTYYSPSNAVVVIVGDLKKARVKELAEEYFADIPRGPPPRKVHTIEPKQKGERRTFVAKPSVTTPNIMIGYHVPASSHKDYYPLKMLSTLLSDGKTSRLYKSLVDQKKLASSVEAYFPGSFDPNLFYVFAVAMKGVKVEDLEKAIYKEIREIAESGIKKRELQKAKNQIVADFYRTLETINGKADALGTFETKFGDYKRLFTNVEQFEKLGADTIQRVAAKYFKKSNRTVGILDSKEK